MPNMDGIQALKEIKKIDSNAKVIMCSAMGQESMVVEAIRSGAIDFIVKPFQADRIIQTVRKALA
jgi:two-component system chemotaxis response regulator CheY